MGGLKAGVPQRKLQCRGYHPQAFNIIDACIFNEDISILNNIPIYLLSFAPSFVGYGKLMIFQISTDHRYCLYKHYHQRKSYRR